MVRACLSKRWAQYIAHLIPIVYGNQPFFLSLEVEPGYCVVVAGVSTTSEKNANASITLGRQP